MNFLPTADPRFLIALRPAAGDRRDVAIWTTSDRCVLLELPKGSHIGGHGNGDVGRVGIVADLPGGGEPRAVFLPDARTLALIPVGNNRFERLKADLSGGGLAAAGGSDAAGGAG